MTPSNVHPLHPDSLAEIAATMDTLLADIALDEPDIENGTHTAIRLVRNRYRAMGRARTPSRRHRRPTHAPLPILQLPRRRRPMLRPNLLHAGRHHPMNVDDILADPHTATELPTGAIPIHVVIAIEYINPGSEDRPTFPRLAWVGDEDNSLWNELGMVDFLRQRVLARVDDVETFEDDE